MKKINDSSKEAQSRNNPVIVPYFLSTLMSNAAITLGGYLEIWILGTGKEATQNLASYAGIATVQAWITAIAYFLAMGVGCAVAEATEEEAVQKGRVGLLAAACVGGCMVLLTFMLRPEWMMLLGAKKESVAQTYMGVRWMLLASPCLMISHVFGTFFRGLGKKVSSSVGLTLMGSGQILSMFLLRLWGMDALTGVVWSVVIGEALSLSFYGVIWIIFLIKRRKNGLTKSCVGCERKNFVMETLLEITKSGVPSLARQGSISVGLWATNLIAGSYSLAAQSVMTAAGRFMTLPFGIVIAVCQAYQPIASKMKERKEGKKEEYFIARRFGLWMITIAVTGVLIAGKGVLNLIPGKLPGKNTLLAIIGSQTMVLPAVFYSQLVITQLQVLKDWKAGTLLAVLRNGLVFVPVLWVLNQCFEIWGLFFAQGVTDLLVLPMSMYVLKKRASFDV